ncbi:MAG: hypothetical protein H6579_10105 [Chitinophagales bacterium]|nr:hypothetical protein [Chitinophagales bacterium]
MKNFFYLFIVAALFSACQNTTNTEEPTESVEVDEVAEDNTRSTTSNPLYNDLMMPTAGGMFRGVEFDMSREKVYNLETSRSTISVYKDETDEELVVTTDMGKEVLDFADITYRFDEQGLYGIQVETYATTFEKSEEVFDMIVAYYTEEFGKPSIADDGYTEFEAYSEKTGYDYKISIKNLEDYEDSFGLYMYFDLQ